MANMSEVVTIFAKSIPFRKTFNLAMKKPKETPNEWLARIKTLAELCGFGHYKNLFILDKFLTGFNAEITDHLCSTAQYLDIESALGIIEAYSMPNNCNGIDTIVMHDKNDEVEPKELRSNDPIKPPISEILIVKCETDDEETVYQNENDFNDDVFDDGVGVKNSGNSSSSDGEDNTKRDSDFHLSDYELTGLKKSKEALKKQREAPKVKRKYVKKKDRLLMLEMAKLEKAESTEPIDPNAPKKRRKYKQRAIKVKEIVECDYCHWKTPHKCHLARHMMIHLNEKSFICHECGKGFNLSVNLNAHLRRHAGYKPHVCEVCKAGFMDKARLIMHMRTHTGERPYGCNLCEKRFADRYYMKIHMRFHTGEKPFKCDQCLRNFSQSSSLSLHKRKNCTALYR